MNVPVPAQSDMVSIPIIGGVQKDAFLALTQAAKMIPNGAPAGKTLYRLQRARVLLDFLWDRERRIELTGDGWRGEVNVSPIFEIYEPRDFKDEPDLLHGLFDRFAAQRREMIEDRSRPGFMIEFELGPMRRYRLVSSNFSDEALWQRDALAAASKAGGRTSS